MLSERQWTFLRALARRTWRYFEVLVDAEEHWLPPDNFQEVPEPVVASRTSPTNIGLALLANLAAHDFGYLSGGQLLERTDNTLAAMERLERYRGHFYNWYDTRTLQPAAAALRVERRQRQPARGAVHAAGRAGGAESTSPSCPTALSTGLADTLRVLQDQARGIPALLRTGCSGRRRSSDAPRDDTVDAIVERLQEIWRTAAGIAAGGSRPRARRPALVGERSRAPVPRRAGGPARASSPSPSGPAAGADPAGGWRRAPRTGGRAAERIRRIDDLAQRCAELAEMDFSFLYDSACNLLSVGYDVGDRRRDLSHYDQLASESRLASFLLIAQGQVPQEHWFALGRQLTAHDGALALLSWSGSMFEYLMPLLVMPTYAHTLLDETYRAVVARQIDYGRERGVPWGISESCYNATDAGGAYQYRAFGVPGLGFKRGLADDLVVAPYASALALMVAPRRPAGTWSASRRTAITAPSGCTKPSTSRRRACRAAEPPCRSAATWRTTRG